MSAALARAEQAAAEHGLTLDWDDTAWPLMGKRIVSLRIQRNGEILARAAQTYSDEAGKNRAREACAGVLFMRQ